MSEEDEFIEEAVEEEQETPIEEAEETGTQEQAETPTSTYRYGFYRCPACGRLVPFFLSTSPRSGWVKCPACGRSIAKRSVPEEAIIYDRELTTIARRRHGLEYFVRKVVEKGYINKSPEEILEELREAEEGVQRPVKMEPRREEPRPVDVERGVGDRPAVERQEKPIRMEKLFERPKTPCEVLQEVLEEFALRDEFKHAMIRRCERNNGMHPVELLHYLVSMKSGVKTQGEAQFIAEEYAAALRAEMEKARQLNMPYPTIPLTENVPVTSPIASRLLQIVPPQQYAPNQPQIPSRTSPTGPMGYSGYPQGQSPTTTTTIVQPPSQDVGGLLRGLAELLRSIVPQQTQQTPQGDGMVYNLIIETFKSQQEFQMKQMEMIAKSIEEGMKSLGEGVSKAFEQVAKTIEELQKKKEADPELVYKAAKAEAEKEFYQKLLEMYKEEQKQLQQYVESLAKKIEEMSVMSTQAVSEFRSDNAKLMAQALNQAAGAIVKLIDSLDKRQPVKLIIEALPYVTSLSSKTKKIPKKYRETETMTGEQEVLEELVEQGLVEEE